MGNLVTFQEILARYEAGENAFDLTLEKWGRIRKFVENAFTLQHFRETLDGAVIKVPLCFISELESCKTESSKKMS